jgi:hypothetical protein
LTGCCWYVLLRLAMPSTTNSAYGASNQLLETTADTASWRKWCCPFSGKGKRFWCHGSNDSPLMDRSFLGPPSWRFSSPWELVHPFVGWMLLICFALTSLASHNTLSLRSFHAHFGWQDAANLFEQIQLTEPPLHTLIDWILLICFASTSLAFYDKFSLQSLQPNSWDNCRYSYGQLEKMVLSVVWKGEEILMSYSINILINMYICIYIIELYIYMP